MDGNGKPGVSGPSATILCIELVLLTYGGVSLCTFMVVLQKTKCFHRNLCILLMNLCVSFMLVTISRFLIDLPLLASFFSGGQLSIASIGFCRFAKTMRDTGIYVGGLDLFALVIERACATVRVRTYETIRSSALAVMLVAAQWIIAAIFVVMNQMGSDSVNNEFYTVYLLPCQREYLSKTAMALTLSTAFIADCIALVVFISLLHFNKHRYATTSLELNEHCLSERYQISENVRSTRLLWPMMGAYLLGSIIGVCFATVGVNKKAQANEHVNDLPVFFDYLRQAGTWGQALDLVVALLTVILPHLAMRGHDSLSRGKRRLSSFCSHNKLTPEVAPLPLNRLDGTRMVMLQREERDIYFAQLQNMWNR